MQIINQITHSQPQEKPRNKRKIKKKHSCQEKKKVDLDNSLFIKQFLSPETAKLAYLDKSERHIVEKELNKMIKGVKAQLKMKAQVRKNVSQNYEADTKTKKFEFFDTAENIKTKRKLNFTARKNRPCQDGSISERTKIKSPPNKHHESIISQTTKRKKHSKDEKSNFYLMGDSFVHVNEKITQQLKEEMMREQKIWRQDSSRGENSSEQLASDFYQTSRRVEPNEEVLESQISSKDQEIKTMEENSRDKEHKNPETWIEKNSQNLQIFSNYDSKQATIEEFSLSSIDCSPEKLTKEKNQDFYEQGNREDIIDIRIRAINVQMKTGSQFLLNLLKQSKINQSQYQEYLDLVMMKYDQEITEAHKLKELLAQNETKISNIVSKTKNILYYSDNLSKQKTGSIDQSFLQTVFQQIKTEVCEYKSQSSENAPKDQETLLFTHSDPKKLIFEDVEARKLIEERISEQVGMTRIQTKPKVNTSILGIFQFLKKFYQYSVKNNCEEILKYLNMPYGYNIAQRLTYMQGYQTDLQNEDQYGIIYGIEEVLSHEIFLGFCQAEEAHSSQLISEEEKIHNKAIFDAMNQAMNYYRPYYYMNGQPYPWSYSQKSLTFFYISKQNLGQVLEKVQFQIMKWSSLLCGLIVPDLVGTKSEENIEIQQITQIFQQYSTKTHPALIEIRQQKAIKAEKEEVEKKKHQWELFQEQKTAILIEISSLILEEISNEPAIFLCQKLYGFGSSIKISHLL